MDLKIREDLNRLNKVEVYSFLVNEAQQIDKSHKLSTELGFKEYFPELYEEMINSGFDNYPSFKQKLWHFFNDDYSIHYCHCGKELKFISIVKGYRTYCSNECKYSDDNYLQKVSDNTKELWKTNGNMKNTLVSLSQGRDNWWANLSKEERTTHTKPLHDAMKNAVLNMSDEQKQEMYKKREEKSKITRNNKPHEIKSAELEKRIKSYKNTLANRSNEKKKEVSMNVSNGLKNMREEQKKQRDINKHLAMIKRTQKIYPDVIDLYTPKNNKNTIYTCSCQNPECKKCENKIYKTTLGSFAYRRKLGIETCPICHPRTIGTSSGEKEVLEYIQSIYNGVIIANDRDTLSGKEIDIYLPELKIGFEYQGDLWHANPLLYDETFVHPINNKTYEEIHNADDEKKKSAKLMGIKLIEVWETDWVEHQRITKRMIKNIIHENRNCCK